MASDNTEFRLVMIEWVDSFGCSSDWQELPDSFKPKSVLCRSVGWLVYDGEECKVIVPHMGEPVPGVARQGCGDMTIPVACIQHVRDLIVASPSSKLPSLIPDEGPNRGQGGS